MKTRAITQVGAGVGVWSPLDNDMINFLVGLAVVKSGTVVYTIEHTYDNIQDPAVVPTAWPSAIAGMVGASTNQEGSITVPCTAVRINQASGSGTTVLTIVQQGIR